MDMLLSIFICAASVLVSAALVYFLIFPRLRGFKLDKHKVIGGIVFAPLQGIATAAGFGAALYVATLTSVITALGGGISSVPIIYCTIIGGTAVVFFVANLLLIMLYKAIGIFEIDNKPAMLLGVCSLMGAQLVGCIISVICCIGMFAKDNTFSFIDTTGKVVIDKKFSNAHEFKNGKARVTLISQKDNVDTYINHRGEVVPAPTEPEPEIKYKLDDDPSLYESSDDWGVGRATITSHNLSMLPFSEGFAAAFNKDNLSWGFVDTNFQFKIAPKNFDDVRHFKEGLAPVCIKDESPQHKRLWGYVDKTGTIVIKPQFHGAECFSDGLAKVSVPNPKEPNTCVYGFIDKSGNFAIKPEYRFATSFSEGVAAVAK